MRDVSDATRETSDLDGAQPSVSSLDRAAYPALYQVADQSSVAGQRQYRWLVEAELVLILAGALFGAVGAFVGQVAAPGASLAAASLLGAIALKLYNRQAGGDARWFDGRAVAETVKTQTWRYMMRVAPYQDDGTADEAFSEDLLHTLRARPDLRQPLDALPLDPRQISPQMRAIRARPLDARRDTYAAARISDQAAWYRGRALDHRARSGRWFAVSLASQVAAALLALVAVFRPDEPLTALLGVFAALAAVATAWTQLLRHDELHKAYALAYQELITIRGLADRVTTESELEHLVTTGEAAISREHTMWMAKLGRTTPAPAP